MKAAKILFLSKGYQETSISDIMKKVRERSDLNGLEKMRELLLLNQRDPQRNTLNLQAMEILKDPQILAMAVASNRRLLTPLWLELLEEGQRDGSIQT